MLPTDREIMRQALEALENPWKAGPDGVANAITALRERLAQPEPPPECKTEEEKTAFAFGYWKAVEAQRVAQPEQGHVINCPRCGHCCPQRQEQEPVIDKLGCVPPSDTSQERVAETEKLRQEQEPTVKHMTEWVEYLKRQSDHGQHLHIWSGMSAGTCWELAIELEQFISTTPPQRREWVGLTEEQVVVLWRKHKEVMGFARELLTIEREAVLKLVRTYVSNKNLEEAIETRLFDDWGSFPYKGCPPCNQNCRQGRDCPARK